MTAIVPIQFEMPWRAIGITPESRKTLVVDAKGYHICHAADPDVAERIVSSVNRMSELYPTYQPKEK